MRQTRQNAKAKPENMRKFSCKRCPWVESTSNCVDKRLLDAARVLDVEGAKAAVADGADQHARDDDGKDAMARASDPEIVRHLKISKLQGKR